MSYAVMNCLISVMLNDSDSRKYKENFWGIIWEYWGGGEGYCKNKLTHNN